VETGPACPHRHVDLRGWYRRIEARLPERAHLRVTARRRTSMPRRVLVNELRPIDLLMRGKEVSFAGASQGGRQPFIERFGLSHELRIGQQSQRDSMPGDRQQQIVKSLC